MSWSSLIKRSSAVPVAFRAAASSAIALAVERTASQSSSFKGSDMFNLLVIKLETEQFKRTINK